MGPTFAERATRTHPEVISKPLLSGMQPSHFRHDGGPSICSPSPRVFKVAVCRRFGNAAIMEL